MAAAARDQLVTPVVDGLVIDGFHLKFSGTVHLDPTNAGDLAMIEDLKLGRTIRVQVRANIDAGPSKINRDNGGAIRTVVDARQLVVDQVDSMTILREPERAKILPAHDPEQNPLEAAVQDAVEAAAPGTKATVRTRRRRAESGETPSRSEQARVGAKLTPVPDAPPE